MAVAITLTLTLSHQGRGDIEVLPEGVFGVGRVVAHVTREMSQLVSCVVHLGGVVVRLYEPPASLRSASPFCSAKRGGFAAAPLPRAYPALLSVLCAWAICPVFRT